VCGRCDAQDDGGPGREQVGTGDELQREREGEPPAEPEDCEQRDRHDDIERIFERRKRALEEEWKEADLNEISRASYCQGDGTSLFRDGSRRREPAAEPP